MNRLIAAACLTVAASVLAACGDAGDHLFDFHQNHPTPTPSASASGAAGAAVVSKVVLSLSQTPNQNNAGTYPLTVTLYNASNAVIPIGTPLSTGLVLTSNDSCAVTFTSTASGATFTNAALATMTSAPGTSIVLSYNPGSCTAQTVTVTASLQSGAGNSGALSFFTPPPSSGGAAVVSAIVVTLDASPSPNSAGTYPLNITIYDQNGNIILPGTLLASNVVVTSNDDCAVTFGLPVAGETSFTFGTAVQTNSAPGSGIILAYNPESGCSAQSVTVTVNLQSNAATFGSLSLFGGEATVTSLTITPLATPNPDAAGIYPFFVPLTGSVSGGAVGLLPAGDTLANPVTLTSNNACVVSFGTSPNIATGTGTQAVTISSTSTIAYLFFNPGSASAICPASANIIVYASATGVTTQSYAFTNGLPVTSVRRRP